MQNPWSTLPDHVPFVLAEDQPHIEAFNAEVNDRHRLNLEVLPQPFLGNHHAGLLILNRNPGERGWKGGAYADALQAEITSEAGQHVPPLLPTFVDNQGGWWAKCFRAVLHELGKESTWLSERLLAVEFHGYHSKSYKSMPITLPSQGYGFDLVGRAVQRGATVVIMRGGRDWRVAVPSIRQANTIELRNPQSATLSERNCGAEGFRRILEALDGC